MATLDILYQAEEADSGNARLDRWLVEPGASVSVDMPVAELETDKVTLEVVSPANGVLSEHLIMAGSEVKPGDPIGRLNLNAGDNPDLVQEPPVDVRFVAEEPEATAAKVAQWLIGVGDPIAADAPLVEIETDKVTLEVVSPCDGVLEEIVAAVGASIVNDELLGRIRPGKGAPQARTTAAAGLDESADSEEIPIESLAGRDRLSPAVRRLIREHDIDLARIRGTGRGGRVTKEDVVKWLSDHPTPADGAGGGAAPSGPSSRMVPHTTMRRSIAKHMVESLLQTSPHVTSVFEVDLTRIVRHRKANKADFAARGVNLTYTAYFLAAAARAMQTVPEVNARFHEDALELFEDVNIGIGTALGNEGLIVPVVPRVQAMDLHGIAAGLHDKTERARTGELSPADLKGGTFTISNHGVSGSLFASPIIINQPQVAILGVGKMEKRVKVIELDGEDILRIRPMCYVSLSIDHRALDAYQTNQWLAVFVEHLEDWPQD